jgi:endonuclease YncB( thermonuclease family)
MCFKGLFKFFCNKNNVSDCEVCHDYGFDRDFENPVNTNKNEFLPSGHQNNDKNTNMFIQDENTNMFIQDENTNMFIQDENTNMFIQDENIDESVTILNLNKYSKSSAPKLHTMNGKELWCKIIDVYDGDTVDIIFYSGKELVHHKFRLYGIDTPELKPLKNISNRNEIIEKAKEAKLYLEKLVLNKIVYIRFKNEEKYGRLMGNIYFTKSENQKSINQKMIDSGLAVEYYGQKK